MMTEPQAREAFYASCLLHWLGAANGRIVRIIYEDTRWIISATEGPWCLQVEGACFVETARLLFTHAAEHGFTEDMMDNEPEDEPDEPGPELYPNR